MSLFDEPFNPSRLPDGPNCVCGRHRSQAEHDHAAQLTLQCAPFESPADHKDKRFAGIVAANAMRTAFPRPPRA